MGQVGLFVLGSAIIANTIYGMILWRHTMPKNVARTLATILAVVWYPLTATVMLVYVPLVLWRRRRVPLPA